MIYDLANECWLLCIPVQNLVSYIKLCIRFLLDGDVTAAQIQQVLALSLWVGHQNSHKSDIKEKYRVQSEPSSPPHALAINVHR